MSSDEIHDAVLMLPTRERAKLAYELLRSLDGPAGAGAGWIAEIERHAHELADGSVQPVEWEAARERIWRRLCEHRQ